MNPNIKLAIEAIQKQIHLINLDAQLYETGIVNTAHARNCFLKRQKLRAAIQWLESNDLPPRSAIPDPPETIDVALSDSHKGELHD